MAQRSEPGSRDRSVPVTVGLYPHQVAAVDALARRRDVTRSDIVRKAIAAYAPLRDILDEDLDGRNGGG